MFKRRDLFCGKNDISWKESLFKQKKKRKKYSRAAKKKRGRALNQIGKKGGEDLETRGHPNLCVGEKKEKERHQPQQKKKGGTY